MLNPFNGSNDENNQQVNGSDGLAAGQTGTFTVELTASADVSGHLTVTDAADTSRTLPLHITLPSSRARSALRGDIVQEYFEGAPNQYVYMYVSGVGGTFDITKPDGTAIYQGPVEDYTFLADQAGEYLVAMTAGPSGTGYDDQITAVGGSAAATLGATPLFDTITTDQASRAYTFSAAQGDILRVITDQPNCVGMLFPSLIPPVQKTTTHAAASSGQQVLTLVDDSGPGCTFNLWVDDLTAAGALLTVNTPTSAFLLQMNSNNATARKAFYFNADANTILTGKAYGADSLDTLVYRDADNKRLSIYGNDLLPTAFSPRPVSTSSKSSNRRQRPRDTRVS